MIVRRCLVAMSAAVLSASAVLADDPPASKWREVQRLGSVHTPRLTGLAFSPDGKSLATVGGGSEVLLHDLTGATPARTLDGHVDAVRSVAWSPDGKTLVTAGGIWNQRGTIVFWNAETGERRRVVHAGRGTVLTMAFTDFHTLAIGCGYKDDAAVGDLLLLDAESGGVDATFPTDGGPILSLACSPHGKSLLTAGYYLQNDVEIYSVNLWDVETRTHRRTLATYHGYHQGVSAVGWSPDGRYMAAVGRNGSDGRVLVWTGAGAPWAELANHGAAVWSLAFSSDSRTLAAGDAAQRAVRLWEVQSGRERASLDAIPGAVFALEFAADGHTLAAGGTDGQNGVLLRWTSLPRGE